MHDCPSINILLIYTHKECSSKTPIHLSSYTALEINFYSIFLCQRIIHNFLLIATFLEVLPKIIFFTYCFFFPYIQRPQFLGQVQLCRDFFFRF